LNLVSTVTGSEKKLTKAPETAEIRRYSKKMVSQLSRELGKVRRNFYVGVRTPWTLASERVWNDTHRLAAKLFVGAGIIGLAAVVLPFPLPAVIITVVASMIVAGLIPAVYSLILYKRLEKLGELDLGEKPVG